MANSVRAIWADEIEAPLTGTFIHGFGDEFRDPIDPYAAKSDFDSYPLQTGLKAALRRGKTWNWGFS
jgi:hypothetical protein